MSRFGRFHEDFPFSRNRPENHSHYLGKALGEGLGLLCAPFTSVSLSPLYPFHLSLALSLSLSLSLSLISPSLSISLLLPYFLSLSFSLLLSIILFGVSDFRSFFLIKCHILIINSVQALCV